MDTAPGDLIPTKEYYDRTELIKVAFHNRSESVLKLKGAMIPLTVEKRSSKYGRYRYIREMLFMNQHQDTDVTSNRNTS